MPPKGKGKFREDWTWVGTEVKSVDGIRDLHRLRAAGLVGGTPCALKIPSNDETGSSSSSKTTGKSSCNPGRCKTSPWCLNHLGIAKVYTATKEEYVDDHLEGDITRRDGLAGLRNAGATCYANAFLQVWYHNVALRSAVYQAVSTTTPTALYQLAVIFASLEHSDRAVVDPVPLLDRLGVKLDIQQDASEFFDLFLGHISTAFEKQVGSGKNQVEALFEGQMEYRTTCLTCNSTFTRQDTFLNLRIIPKNNATIEECLRMQSQAERLQGSNAYHCETCGEKRAAERVTSPSTLPPILNLTISRNNLSGGKNGKDKTAIKYGNIMNLGGQRYELKAVVTHIGSGANHGHFICDVFDEERDKWFECNDELVKVKNDRKRPKLLASAMEDTLRSSKDAYVLVYQNSNFKASRSDPSQAIHQVIAADNRSLETDTKTRDAKKQALEKEFEELQTAKKDVIKVFQGTDVLVPRDALSNWLHADCLEALNQEWGNWMITCKHDGIDPHKTADARYISFEAAEKLHNYTPLPPLDICHVCVEEEFERRLRETSHAEVVAEFESALQDGPYVLSKKWIDAWRKGKAEGSPTEDLFCKHEARWENGCKVIKVSPEALAILRSVTPDFHVFKTEDPHCGECAEEFAGDHEAEQERARIVKEEKKLKTSVNPRPAPFNVEFNLLPEGFVDEWESWHKSGGDMPNLDMKLCPHGQLDWDPMMRQPDFVSIEGWEQLNARYGPTDGVTIQFGANPIPGKVTSVNNIDHGVCEECRVKRALDFDKTTIYVVQSSEEVKPINGVRSSRSKVKEMEIEITKTMKIKDLKVEILNKIGLSPICQRLRYNGQILDTQATIAELGIMADDRVQLEELEENDDFGDDVGPSSRAGFQNTALTQGFEKACPECTFLNGPYAIVCEICQEPLRI